MNRILNLLLKIIPALAVLVCAVPCFGQPPGQAVLAPEGGAARAAEKPVLLIVRLPATARLEIEGASTKQTGEVRQFISPPVATGFKYVYSIKATWLERGNPVVKEQQVPVQPGQQTVVDLRMPSDAKGDVGAPPKPEADKPAIPGADRAPIPPAPPAAGTPVPPPGLVPSLPAEDKKPAPPPAFNPVPPPAVNPVPPPAGLPNLPIDDKKPMPEMKPGVDRRKLNDQRDTEFISTPLDNPANSADDKPAADKKAADDKKADDKKPPKQPDVIFVPTPQDVVDKMLELAAVKKEDLVYDLGCGDGIIVVTAAKKYGCKAKGFDIDPERIKDSNENVKKNKVEDLVEIKNQDIFTLDLSKANVVTLYLLPELNVKLMPQLEKMKPGSRIVSHDFEMKGAKPDKVVKVKPKGDNEREHTIYLWTIPLKKD